MQVQCLNLHSLQPNADTVPTTPFSPAKCRYSSYNSTLFSQMQVQCLQLHSLQSNAGTVPTTPLSPAKCRYSAFTSTTAKCRYSAYNYTPAKSRYSAYIKPTPLLSTSSLPYNPTFDASQSQLLSTPLDTSYMNNKIFSVIVLKF